MKYTYITLIFSVITQIALAQITTVVNNLDVPSRCLLIGDELYFSQDNEVSKIDLTDTNPIPVVVESILQRPEGLAISGNELYIAAFENGDIYKIDLTEENPYPTFVVSSGQTPNMLLLHGTDLYYTDNTGGSLYRFNINWPLNTSAELVTSAFTDGPIGLEIKDNYLYISEAITFGGGRLHRLDLTSPMPVLEELLNNLERPIGMEFRGNDLYIAQMDGDNIIKVDVTQTPMVAEEVIAINSPTDITFYNDTMYIIRWSDNVISKVDLDQLSITEVEKPKIALTTNPVRRYLEFTGIVTPKPYSVYDINGRMLKAGKIDAHNPTIDVSTLSHGSYFVNVEAVHLKFLKI